MDFWKKILILAILIIFSYILLRLLIRRNQILYESKTISIENFTPSNTPMKISNLNISALTIENGITNPDIAKRVKQFVIKASYHSAYNGSDLTTAMITYLLSRGVRWFDFCTMDGKTVCYTSDDTINGFLSTYTKPTFGEISTKLIMHGFISPDSPNSGDPIFIQIRPLYSNTDKNGNLAMMSNLTESIKSFTKLYSEKISNTTTIDKLLEKVIIVMDENNNSSNDNDNDKTISINLNKLVHLNSNDGVYMKTISSNQLGNLNAPLPSILNDNFTTNPPKLIYQILPTGSTANNDIYSTIKTVGSQITPMVFWSNDASLGNYEDIFNNANSGIAPLSTIIKYVTTNNPNDVASSYPGAFSGRL